MAQLHDDSLETLVGHWLTLPDVAERLGVPVTRVRQLVTDGELPAVRIGERKVLAIPARFVEGDQLRADLPGTITLLRDGGMADEEILTWFFTDNVEMRDGGTPMSALEAGFKTAVRRSAQLLAF